ncbi:MAG: asparagine synthetase B [Gammaproteobacteria bacterium]|nr:asparagine synthetase B [Gammaproteobacteria bacterium]
MSGFCGWLDVGENNPATVDIDRLAATLFPVADTPEKHVFNSGALFVADNRTRHTTADGITAVVRGFLHAAGTPDTALGSEDLIALYRQHGVDIARYLGGRFAIVIVDGPAQRVVLAVDRCGREPLCWAQTDDGIVFGSRANAVASHPAVAAAVRPQAIYDYLYFHVIPSPGTAWRGVEKLEPAHVSIWEDGTVKSRCYWSPAFDQPSDASIEELGEQLQATLTDAVRLQTNSTKTGAFLSGGLDSSTVCGLLRERLGEPARCFTIGFDATGYDELEYARIASRHFDNELIHYYLTADDVANSVEEIAGAYDEPFGNSSAIAALWCARLARDNGIETLLAGDGGDELFAGNERYRKQLAYSWYHRLPGLLRAPLDFVADRSPGPGARRFARIAFYLDKARARLPGRLHMENFVPTTGSATIFSDRLLAAIDVDAPYTSLQQWYAQAPDCGELQNMLYLDWKLTLADNDLRKVVRMSEVAGIGVRFPFLTDAMLEFAASIPEQHLMTRMRLRHFYKESMKDFLPQQIIEKRKQGFGLPLGRWLVEHPQLRQTAADALSTLVRRGIVRDSFATTLQDGVRGPHDAYYGAILYVYMMLELWLAQHAPQTSF